MHFSMASEEKCGFLVRVWHKVKFRLVSMFNTKGIL